MSTTDGAQLTSSGRTSMAGEHLVFATKAQTPTATSIALQGDAEPRATPSAALTDGGERSGFMAPIVLCGCPATSSCKITRMQLVTCSW